MGAGQLFSQALSEQTRWYKQSGNSYYARQWELAYFYLENQYPDYPCAAIFAFEAFITRLIPKGENVFVHESRRNVQDHFEQHKFSLATKPSLVTSERAN